MRAWLFALTLAVSGCGGAALELAGPGQAEPASGAWVVVVPHQDKLPFDPRSARLAQAAGQLASLVGHPVVLELDAALLPEWTSSFEQQLIESIENAARDLVALRRASPRVFQRSASLLDRIACRYVATARGATGVFDTSLRAVVITQPPQGSALVGRGVVRRALEEEFESYLDQQYRSRTADQVPAAERGAYFEYLTMTRPGYGTLWERRARKAQAELPELDRLAREPHAETILRVARLAELAGNTNEALAAQVRAWLVEQAAWFDHLHDTRAALLDRISPDSPLRRSEQAYVRWLSANLGFLSDPQRLSIARVMFPGRGRCSDSASCLDQPASFPGFDRLGFGFWVMEQWQADGRRTEGEGPRFELQAEVVCPHVRGSDGRRTRNRSCSAGLYQQAMATGANRARLVRELVRRGDPALVDEVFSNSGLVPADRVIALWRALLPHGREWQAAARVVTEHLLQERDHAEAIVAEGKRLWRDVPGQRGVALLILTHTTRGLDRHYSDPRWAAFAGDYGEPVSQQVLSGFLEQGTRAMKLVPHVWPALATGFSRAEPIVARLNAFLDDPEVRAGRDGEPGTTLRAIAGRMCDEGGHQDLARLHGWLRQRAGTSPRDAAELAALIADTSGCRAPAPAAGGLNPAR